MCPVMLVVSPMKRYRILITALVIIYVALGLTVYPLENKGDVIYTMPPNGNFDDVAIHYWDKRSWYKKSSLNKSKLMNRIVYRMFYPLVLMRLQTVTLVKIVGDDGKIDFDVQ